MWNSTTVDFILPRKRRYRVNFASPREKSKTQNIDENKVHSTFFPVRGETRSTVILFHMGFDFPRQLFTKYL